MEYNEPDGDVQKRGSIKCCFILSCHMRAFTWAQMGARAPVSFSLIIIFRLAWPAVHDETWARAPSGCMVFRRRAHWRYGTYICWYYLAHRLLNQVEQYVFWAHGPSRPQMRAHSHACSFICVLALWMVAHNDEHNIFIGGRDARSRSARKNPSRLAENQPPIQTKHMVKTGIWIFWPMAFHLSVQS